MISATTYVSPDTAPACLLIYVIPIRHNGLIGMVMDRDSHRLPRGASAQQCLQHERDHREPGQHVHQVASSYGTASSSVRGCTTTPAAPRSDACTGTGGCRSLRASAARLGWGRYRNRWWLRWCREVLGGEAIALAGGVGAVGDAGRFTDGVGLATGGCWMLMATPS